ncbi:hypothetical protein GE061_004227 [Apolygus lucorum]|uniref:Uncharacterized protein n=1 Tax=Apolygus lucorum TaxID=248454 RepID=A0A8S9WYL1_APOLU|nr:hypothetical protein GE061_004227 [Apolygus lucorum]
MSGKALAATNVVRCLAVSFRPVVQPQPSSTQYQTTFPLKRTLTHQNTVMSSSGRSQLQRQATLPPSPSPSPVPTAPRQAAAPRQPSTASKMTDAVATPDPQDDPPGDHPGAITRDHPQNEGPSRPSATARVQRKPAPHQPPSTVRRKIIQATHSVIKLEPEPIKEAELPLPCVPESAKNPEINQELEVEVADKPVFKNSKEKECWALFKKMSDRGVSVSFETVLRGLLTPTEYRMRRAALMSVC